MTWFLHLIWEIVLTLWDYLVDFVFDRPVETGFALFALSRLFATIVQSGYRGVLFSFGRATKVLEPGVYPLIPLFQKVRKTPVRSITIELASQRLTSADGLVFDVQASVVYRVEEPIKMMVEIDNLRTGLETVLPVIIQEIFRTRTRVMLEDRAGIDQEFSERARETLARWGVTVEQAGFASVSPTGSTLRLTQLRERLRVRKEALDGYLAAGLSPTLATALLGSDRQVMGHAAARYRAAGRRAFLRGRRQRLQVEPSPSPAGDSNSDPARTPSKASAGTGKAAGGAPGEVDNT